MAGQRPRLRAACSRLSRRQLRVPDDGVQRIVRRLANQRARLRSLRPRLPGRQLRRRPMPADHAGHGTELAHRYRLRRNERLLGRLQRRHDHESVDGGQRPHDTRLGTEWPVRPGHRQHQRLLGEQQGQHDRQGAARRRQRHHAGVGTERPALCRRRWGQRLLDQQQRRHGNEAARRRRHAHDIGLEPGDRRIRSPSTVRSSTGPTISARAAS
jgi:hypothetical protein